VPCESGALTGFGFIEAQPHVGYAKKENVVWLTPGSEGQNKRHILQVLLSCRVPVTLCRWGCMGL